MLCPDRASMFVEGIDSSVCKAAENSRDRFWHDVYGFDFRALVSERRIRARKGEAVVEAVDDSEGSTDTVLLKVRTLAFDMSITLQLFLSRISTC
jgi:hypothetical protein